ncbi:MAG: M3 family oligoendopeptidase [Actinobacteria bacterium]|nr:M3 family oligoendopeptidase [Actinomycetota bacterium]
MSQITPTGPNAAGVRWDLAPICADAEAARALLDDAIARADAFDARHRGRVAELDAAGLAAALAELASISNALHRVGSYVSLRRSVDVNDDEARDLETVVDQGLVRAQNALRFFDLEWIDLDDAVAEPLMAAPEVAADRHHLRSSRRFRPHVLPDDQERMLAERDPLLSAWQNLFAQTVANIRAPFDDGTGAAERTVDELLSYLHTPDRPVRLAALEALYAALEPHADVLSTCYDSIVADRLVQDRLRGYATPLDPRHLSNELEPAWVDAMMAAIEDRYGMAQRWFRHKAELMGLERLHLADQYAPLGAGRAMPYAEAVGIVEDSFGRFSDEILNVSRAVFEDRRVDAEPRPGKRGGAFCSSVAQDAQPFILLNHTDTLRDLMTVAHELGHGMHFALASAAQSALSMHAPLALCEVPSTFAELLVFDRMLKEEPDPATRTALVRQELESGFATVFRQTMMVRYEQDAYGARQGGQALTADRLSGFWIDRNAGYYGDSVELPEGYRRGWSYIPHFINTRFYTYAYAFAHLASLTLYALYREDGDAFVGPYLEFLRTGGAASPGEQLGAFGIDLADPATWARGLDEMERMVDLAVEG